MRHEGTGSSLRVNKRLFQCSAKATVFYGRPLKVETETPTRTTTQQPPSNARLAKKKEEAAAGGGGNNVRHGGAQQKDPYLNTQVDGRPCVKGGINLSTLTPKKLRGVEQGPMLGYTIIPCTGSGRGKEKKDEETLVAKSQDSAPAAQTRHSTQRKGPGGNGRWRSGFLCSACKHP